MANKPEDEIPPEKDFDEMPRSSQDTELLPGRVRYQRDMPLDDLLTEEVSPLTEEDMKKVKQVGFGTLGVILVGIVLGIFSCQPQEGPMAYGICSTFLEMTTPYPNTLEYTEPLEGSKTAIRIYFTNIDPFGEYKLEMMECTFGPNEAGGMKLTQVTRNRRPVDAEVVTKFNATLPIVIGAEPYLVVPPDWKNPWVIDKKP